MVRVLLPQGGCTIERVATLLDVDRSALYRQRARYDTSFSSIVGAVCAEQVERYVAASGAIECRQPVKVAR